MLTRWLRPHQREGVQFMFECVAGVRQNGGNGCILADDMVREGCAGTAWPWAPHGGIVQSCAERLQGEREQSSRHIGSKGIQVVVARAVAAVCCTAA